MADKPRGLLVRYWTVFLEIYKLPSSHKNTEKDMARL